MSHVYYEKFALIGPDSNASLEELKLALEKFYKPDGVQREITLSDQKITVRIGNYCFYIFYNRDASVIDESVDIRIDRVTLANFSL